ncbi:MAG: FAD-dependent oxidoreductase, partial [Candidatus Omnitrophota bacterium]
MDMNNFEVIVIGAGHAGIEAACSCANMGLKTLMLTLKLDTVGVMSCNPAIGGVGKGQLVKEIDALGGQMGKAADSCGIQFRVLNASKGPAVQSSRAQIDMYEYNRYMRGLVGKIPNLTLKEGEVKELIVKNGKVTGIITGKKEEMISQAVIICAGTFLDGLIHIGLKHFSAGRINESASIGLGEQLKRIGFNTLRFKTGTCPRLDKNTVDFSKLILQNGDNPARPFSFSSGKITQTQVPCYITYTNPRTHKIIRDNLNRSPLYTGKIKATGV